jgi:4-hydroxy-tetrahydrodipicolinate synthase
MEISGVYTALVTPFRGDELDENALRENVEHQIAGGVSGLVPCGTTGESVTLRGDEHARVVRITVEQTRGRVPVLAGAGTNSTSKTIELAHVCREAGADGLLIVCPYYNKPTQAGLESHFRAVISAVPMPAMLYNVPGRTGSDLAAATVARLADVEHAVSVKEATGNIVRAQQIAALTGDRFAIMSGDDALTLGMLAVGARGVVSVASNLVPDRVSEVVRLWHEGKVAEARAAHLKLVSAYDAMFIESNPGPIKFAMAKAGRIAPEIRLPLAWPTPETQERVASVLRDVGIWG